MDEEAFAGSIRKFLRTVGVGSQKNIEEAVRKATQEGTIAGTESLPVSMTLEIPGLAVRVRFDGELKLQ